jgi:hypothetical protein
LIMAIAMVYFAWVGQGPQRGAVERRHQAT